MWSGALGHIKVMEHKIELKPGSQPVHQHPYRAGPAQRECEKREIDEMLRMGVIEPAKTAWASPVVFVPKPNGSLRFCVDYRKLNAMTVQDSYPIPRMDECIDSLGEAVVFSTFDANSGYWQVVMNQDDMDKTTFTSHFGTYRWLRMPFGLKTAPSTFQRAADIVLASVRWQFALVYLDDIIVYSSQVEDHYRHLDTVFRLLKDAGFTLRLEKCEFFQESVDYLGHIVAPGQLKVQSRACEAVARTVEPETVTQMRSFLGLCNVYRRFVPNFARIAAPLNERLKKGQPTEFGPLSEEEQAAFKELRARLITPPILALPRSGLPMTVETDACDKQVGCVLLQDQPDGQPMKPLGYWSRSLNKAERNYNTTQRECLAVVWAVLMLRPYLYGTRFTLRTDHESLRWILNLSDASGKLQRWRLRLLEFEFDVVHRPGIKHQAADALSRLNTQGEDEEPLEDEVPTLLIATEAVEADEHEVCVIFPAEDDELPGLPEVLPVVTDPATIKPISVEELIAAQSKDEYCRKLMTESDTEGSRFSYDEEGVLIRLSPLDHAQQRVIPLRLQARVLYLSHYPLTAGHPKGSKMYDTMRRHYYWPNMANDVYQTVRDCRACAQTRGTFYKHQRPLRLFPAAGPLEFIAMDLLGPLTKTRRGHTDILVMTDRFSKMARSIPLRSTTAPVVAEAFLNNWVIPYGLPRILLTDNGPQFVSKFFEFLCTALGMKHPTTTAYHPQANGQVERFNGTLVARLRHFITEHHAG